MDDHGVDIWYKTEITSIYFDKDSGLVHCEAGDKKIITKCVVLGHGARLPVFMAIMVCLSPREKYHPRPAFHLVVKDKHRSEVFEAILTSDNLIKYIHNITRFSSLRNSNKV